MTNTNTNITELELSLLTKIANGLYAEYGFTDVVLEDISNDEKRDRGVLSSLIKKGLVTICEHEIFDNPMRPDKYRTVNLLMIPDDEIVNVREITGINFWDDFEG